MSLKQLAAASTGRFIGKDLSNNYHILSVQNNQAFGFNDYQESMYSFNPMTLQHGQTTSVQINFQQNRIMKIEDLYLSFDLVSNAASALDIGYFKPWHLFSSFNIKINGFEFIKDFRPIDFDVMLQQTNLLKATNTEDFTKRLQDSLDYPTLAYASAIGGAVGRNVTTCEIPIMQFFPSLRDMIINAKEPVRVLTFEVTMRVSSQAAAQTGLFMKSATTADVWNTCSMEKLTIKTVETTVRDLLFINQLPRQYIHWFIQNDIVTKSFNPIYGDPASEVRMMLSEFQARKCIYAISIYVEPLLSTFNDARALGKYSSPSLIGMTMQSVNDSTNKIDYTIPDTVRRRRLYQQQLARAGLYAHPSVTDPSADVSLATHIANNLILGAHYDLRGIDIDSDVILLSGIDSTQSRANDYSFTFKWIHPTISLPANSKIHIITHSYRYFALSPDTAALREVPAEALVQK